METTRLVVGAAMRAKTTASTSSSIPAAASPPASARRGTLPSLRPRCSTHASHPLLLLQEGERQSSRYAPSRELQYRAVGARYLCVVTIFVAFELEQPVINMSMLGFEESSDQGTDLAREQRKGDIMELFSQAQRNILSLNKQRLLAMEELKKLQDENKSLLQEIEVLETEVQGVPLEAVQSSTFCELLLRIDTMVVSGMISMHEASDLREKVVNNRSIIQSTFSEIHHKANTELLSKLRLFLRKPIDYATSYLCPNCNSYCLSFKVSAILYSCIWVSFGTQPPT